MVSVEVRQALLEFVIALQARRGDGIATAALDGDPAGLGEQLKALCVFSREGLAALDQVTIGAHLEEPPAPEPVVPVWRC